MPLIAFSEGNLAGETIAQQLIRKHGFEKQSAIKSDDGKYEWESWRKGELRLVRINTLHIFSDYLKDYSLFNSGDLVIFASTHKSETNSPALTAHTPGNFSIENKMGGNPKELAYASPSSLKFALEYLKNHPLEGFPVYMEATHHGPSTLKSPVLFLEIGSTEMEYANISAGEVMADCILEVCGKWEKNEKAAGRVAIGFGGTHYCAKFFRLMVENDYKFGYVCSKHNLGGIDSEVIKQAMEKSIERIEVALIEKKSMNAKAREKIISALNEAGLQYELV